jgi:hypothetical protein
MGQELHAAIAEATRNAPYVRRRELYEKYFRNADWEKFDYQLSLLATEGVVIRRPDPEEPKERLLGLTEIARAGRVPWDAIERGRKRRGEI